MNKKAKNPDHSNQEHRLSRIQGQIKGIEKMIKDKNYCPAILMQLKATRSAIKSLEVAILQQHINHCVKDAVNSKNNKQIEEKVAELLLLFKNFGH